MDVARSADVLKLASLVCALERHHLARGYYPDELRELAGGTIVGIVRGAAAALRQTGRPL